MHLLFPQWQGGALAGLARGAHRLAGHAPDVAWRTVDVDPPSPAPLAREGGILGRAALLRSLRAASLLLATEGPDRVFVLGGDCAVELAPIAHLKARGGDDLALVWLDAHADLNTPASSPSGTFHGMPLRHLFGEGDPAVLALLGEPLRPRAVVLAGVRDLDPPEADFLDAHPGVGRVGAATLNGRPRALGDALAARGFRRVYLHVDLDVLDPDGFRALGWPAPGGLRVDVLVAVLQDLHARFEVVGGGLTEYLPEAGSDTDEDLARRVLRVWLGRPYA